MDISVFCVLVVYGFIGFFLNVLMLWFIVVKFMNLMLLIFLFEKKFIKKFYNLGFSYGDYLLVIGIYFV